MAMNIPLHEYLQDMSTDELRALNDYDAIAESFLSDNFSYRDSTATDSLITGIKAQNLALARFVIRSCRRIASRVVRNGSVNMN